MNTADIPVGSPVFVRWYGKTLQGEVVPDGTGNRLFASMLHVRIPVQGTPIVAVFTPAHVYLTDSPCPVVSPPAPHPIPAAFPAGSPAGTPAITPSWSSPALDAHRARYRQFKHDHWDHEHNHLQVSALEEFYQLFREGVALRWQQASSTASPKPATVRPVCGGTAAAQPRRTPQRPTPVQLTLNF